MKALPQYRILVTHVKNSLALSGAKCYCTSSKGSGPFVRSLIQGWGFPAVIEDWVLFWIGSKYETNHVIALPSSFLISWWLHLLDFFVRFQRILRMMLHLEPRDEWKSAVAAAALLNDTKNWLYTFPSPISTLLTIPDWHQTVHFQPVFKLKNRFTQELYKGNEFPFKKIRHRNDFLLLTVFGPFNNLGYLTWKEESPCCH